LAKATLLRLNGGELLADNWAGLRLVRADEDASRDFQQS
jgi:hypothetical protein